MKKLLYTAIIILFSTHMHAQFAYSFTALTQPYVPLVNGTSITNNKIWRGDTSNFAVSPGFNFKLDTINCSFAFFSGGNTLTTNPNQTIQSGFNVSEVNFIDRGALDSIAKSPVRIDIQGSAGNQVLKIEAYNVGFLPEFTASHTLNDSASVQIWLYEANNTVEIHYGPSRITNPHQYFTYGAGPLVFYIQDNVVTNNSQNGPIYVLAGNASGPVIEPNEITNGTIQGIVIPLHSWPADSTVYRFTLNKLSVPGTNSAVRLKIYPTCAYDDIMVTGSNVAGMDYKVMAINGATTGISGVLGQGNTHVNISNLPQGMYLLAVQNGETKSVQKFVKL